MAELGVEGTVGEITSTGGNAGEGRVGAVMGLVVIEFEAEDGADTPALLVAVTLKV